MAGCLEHLRQGICDPNCAQRKLCHDYSGWNLPDGRRIILHTRRPVSRLVDGGVGDPNVDYAIAPTGDERSGFSTETIPIETLRRSGV